MPSSKFSQRRGRHGNPRVCHTPPIIPPPPPPACPPAAITGWITGDYGELHYYSTYFAPLEITEAGYEYRHTNPDPDDGHDVHIIMNAPPGHFWAQVFWHADGPPDYNFEKHYQPFEWCQHHHLTVSTWDFWSPQDATCVLDLIW